MLQKLWALSDEKAKLKRTNIYKKKSFKRTKAVISSSFINFLDVRAIEEKIGLEIKFPSENEPHRVLLKVNFLLIFKRIKTACVPISLWSTNHSRSYLFMTNRNL